MSDGSLGVARRSRATGSSTRSDSTVDAEAGPGRCAARSRSRWSRRPRGSRAPRPRRRRGGQGRVVRSSPRPPRRTRAAAPRQPESRRRPPCGRASAPASELHVGAEPVEQRLNVRPATTGDGAPAIAAQPEHRVVAEEVDPVCGREVERVSRRGRPERGGHRHQVVPSEGVASSPRRRGTGRTSCRRRRRLPRCAGTGGSRAGAAARRARAGGSTTRAHTRRPSRTTSPTTASRRRARGRGASGSGSSPRCGR